MFPTFLVSLCLAAPCELCYCDLSCDGWIGVEDLAILLGDWGTDGPGDVDGSGECGGADLAALMTNWGPCQN